MSSMILTFIYAVPFFFIMDFLTMKIAIIVIKKAEKEPPTHYYVERSFANSSTRSGKSTAYIYDSSDLTINGSFGAYQSSHHSNHRSSYNDSNSGTSRDSTGGVSDSVGGDSGGCDGGC